MSDKRKILVQLDGDQHPSVFDRVVAVDAGVDALFSYGGVKPEHVRDLVHGAIFTRGPKDLRHTALFIGGSDVSAGEQLLGEALKAMIPQFGLRVPVVFDANGCNTTAAAAVWAAAGHLDLASVTALVLAGTGPVGQRVARLLAGQGARVRVASRQRSRSEGVVAALKTRLPAAHFEPVATANADDTRAALADVSLVVAAGAAGVVLLPRDVRVAAPGLKVVIDLNAVPPLGIEGVEVSDKGVERDGVVAYGALGVGGTKMKLHKAALAKVFERNDQVFDAEEIYSLAATAAPR